MILAENLIESGRPESLGERRAPNQFRLGGGAEKIVSHGATLDASGFRADHP